MAVSLINTECKRYGCMKNLLACYANCRYNTRCEDLKNEIESKTEQAARDINQYLAGRGGKPITIQILKRGLKFSEAAKLNKTPPQSLKADNPEDATAPVSRIVSQKRHKKVVKPIPVTVGKKEAFKQKKQSKPSGIGKSDRLRKVKRPSILEKLSINSSGRIARKRKAAVKSVKKVSSSETIIKKEINHRKPVSMSKNIKRAAHSDLTEISQNPDSKVGTAETIVKQSRPKPNGGGKRKNGSRASTGSFKSGKVFIILEEKTASLVDERGLMMHLLNDPAPGTRYFEASEVEARIHIVRK